MCQTNGDFLWVEIGWEYQELSLLDFVFFYICLFSMFFDYFCKHKGKLNIFMMKALD